MFCMSFYFARLFHHAAQTTLSDVGNQMVYKDDPTLEIHSFETFCLSRLLVESESSYFTIALLGAV
jgi:hypothetical protein